MTAFDWPALLRVGLRELGLAPRDFWALTPAELWLLIGTDARDLPMGRTRLDELSHAYPDHGGATAEGVDNG